ncbi:fatty acid desaturase family protein [Actinomadura alba]|nr:fatty acid desaturase [Actinomadura alba]
MESDLSKIRAEADIMEDAPRQLEDTAAPGRGGRIWRSSPLDAVLLGLSIAHFVATLVIAFQWDDLGPWGRAGCFALLVGMMVYNIIVVSHLFTHQPWFRSSKLNGFVSILNSVNIAQSVQEYRISHVRNHHRYNNDRRGPDGTTKDVTSTYRYGKGDDHANVFRYTVVGGVQTLVDVGRALVAVHRLWRVGAHETLLLELTSRTPGKRSAELRQVQLDRTVQFVGVCLLLVISWQWTLLIYVPAVLLAFIVVNVQNYYEHYGATPENRYANSVSHYGRIYNALSFNDGYHQEHHLHPPTHWSRLPVVKKEREHELNEVDRVISPVPAIVGFLDRKRVVRGR